MADAMDDLPSEPHWLDVDGRRYRATDPAIPSGFREEIFAELLRARRAIQILKPTRDHALIGHNRRQAYAAKVALGERGEPWWDEPTIEGRRARVEAAVLTWQGIAPQRIDLPVRCGSCRRWRGLEGAPPGRP